MIDSFLTPDDLSKIRISFGESLFLSLSLSEEAAELLDILEALLFKEAILFLAEPFPWSWAWDDDWSLLVFEVVPADTSTYIQ